MYPLLQIKTKITMFVRNVDKRKGREMNLRKFLRAVKANGVSKKAEIAIIEFENEDDKMSKKAEYIIGNITYLKSIVHPADKKFLIIQVKKNEKT